GEQSNLSSFKVDGATVRRLTLDDYKKHCQPYLSLYLEKDLREKLDINSWKTCYYYFKWRINKFKKSSRIATEWKKLPFPEREIAYSMFTGSRYLFEITTKYVKLLKEEETKEKAEEKKKYQNALIKTLLHNPFIIYSDTYFQMLSYDLWEYILENESNLPFKIPKHILCVQAYVDK